MNEVKKFAQELVEAGLKVYVTKEDFSWGYFTDGAGIGYFQVGDTGMSTCHIPNTSTGGGFRMYDFLDVGFAQNIVDGCRPHWVSNSDSRLSIPWGSWERFAAKSTWKFIEFIPSHGETVSK